MLLSPSHPYWQPSKNCHFGMAKIKVSFKCIILSCIIALAHTIGHKHFFCLWIIQTSFSSWHLYCTFPGYCAYFCFNGYICRANLDWNGKESYWFISSGSGMDLFQISFIVGHLVLASRILFLVHHAFGFCTQHQETITFNGVYNFFLICIVGLLSFPLSYIWWATLSGTCETNIKTGHIPWHCLIFPENSQRAIWSNKSL